MEKIIEQTAKEIVEKSGLKPVSEQFIYDEESNTYWYSIEGSLGNQKIKDQEILSSLNHLLRRIIETKITKENIRKVIKLIEDKENTLLLLINCH